MKSLLAIILVVPLLNACGQSNPKARFDIARCEARLSPFDINAKTDRESDRDSGFEFGGFRLGDTTAQGEHSLQKNHPSLSVTRAECDSGARLVRAGDRAREDGTAFCDIHGQQACELLLFSFSATTPDNVARLSSFDYTRNFGNLVRPTVDVVTELELAFGKPLWRRSITRSKGWPDIPQETKILWTNIPSAAADEFTNDTFVESIVAELGAGQFAMVRLIHNADMTVTYGMNVEMRSVSRNASHREWADVKRSNEKLHIESDTH